MNDSDSGESELVGVYSIKYKAYSIDYPEMDMFISEPFTVTISAEVDEKETLIDDDESPTTDSVVFYAAS